MQRLWVVAGLLLASTYTWADASLQDIEKQMQKQRLAIRSGSVQMEEIESSLAEASRREAELQRKSANLESRIHQARTEQDTLKKEVREAESSVRRLKGGAGQTIGPVLSMGEGGLLKVLFGRAQFDEIVVADIVARHWLGEASASIGAYVAAANQARTARTRLEDTVRQLEADRRQYQRGLQETQSIKHARRALQNELRSDLALRRQTLKSLEEEARRLRKLLEDAKRNKTKEAPVVRTPVVQGNPRLLRGFGPYKDRATGLELQSTGVVYGVSVGTPVLAAADGQVIFADWFRGYGWLVILSHGGGYFTLYGHCSELSVAKGDAVNRGNRLALSGASGSLDGPSVYFEVREGTSAVHPVKWLAASQ